MADLPWTKTRIAMLEQIAKDPGGYASWYKPLQWLVDNGLVERTTRWECYRITEAGRAALRGGKETGES